MAKPDSLRQMEEEWGKIELRQGVPIQYKGKILMINPVYMIDSDMDQMTRVTNDPLVKKASDETITGKKMLALCMAGCIGNGYTYEEAKAYGRGFREEPPTLVYPGDDTLVAFASKDFGRKELAIGDFKRLQSAFSEVNFLAEEDTDTFFTFPTPCTVEIDQ